MILFFSPRDPYGCFSNFSHHPVAIYGSIWKTSEHAYQAKKFHQAGLVKLIQEAPTAKLAAQLGRNPENPLRPDWDSLPHENVRELLGRKGLPEDGLDRKGFTPEPLFSRVKDVVMLEVIRAKVLQNKSVLETLTRTENEPIVEGSPKDGYWGWGPAKMGQNKLGRLYMYVRDNLV